MLIWFGTIWYLTITLPVICVVFSAAPAALFTLTARLIVAHFLALLGK
jgi:hypothetical protein